MAKRYFITSEDPSKSEYNEIISQTYDKESDKAMSGVAVNQALLPITELNILGWTVPDYSNITNYIDNETHLFHQKVNRVEMNTLKWSWDSANNRFHVILNGCKFTSGARKIDGCVTLNRYIGASNLTDKTFFIGGSKGEVYVYDSDYTSSTYDFIESLSGIYLYYEMANENIIPIGSNGIASWLENNDIAMLGWKVPKECPFQNYTIYKDNIKTFYQRVQRVNLSDCTWTYTEGKGFATNIADVRTNGKCYCSKYPYSDTPWVDGTCSNSYGVIYITDSNYATVSDFQIAIANIYLYYELWVDYPFIIDGCENTLWNTSDDINIVGWKVPKECLVKNYTDSKRVFHKKVERLNLGSKTWTLVSGKGFSASLSAGKANGRCYCYKYSYSSSPWTSNCCSIDENKTLTIADTSYATADDFKTAMSGIYLYYELGAEKTYALDGNEIVYKASTKIDRIPIRSVTTGATLSYTCYPSDPDALVVGTVYGSGATQTYFVSHDVSMSPFVSKVSATNSVFSVSVSGYTVTFSSSGGSNTKWTVIRFYS